MRIETMRSAAPRIVAVNEAIIANADIAREVQNHKAASPVIAWEAATRALVVRELLSQRARALNLVPEPRSENGLRETDEEALIRMLLEAEVKTPSAEDADCRRYYLANQARFRSPDLYEPLHILFKAARDDKAAYAQAVTQAEIVLAEVQAFPERFESIAKALSACPSSSEGGRLGQVARGDTTPEFEAALLPLTAGQTCPEVVRTRYGVHVLRLDRKDDGAVLPFEQVRDRIASYLEASSSRRAAAQYLTVLAGQARISGFDIAGATSPLVQ
ncbi:peptidyl-prolyl cis-trans isomerase C [Humitalea rosea]|uniref:Parvulin-like PPIase n=1 Tax=Humitalea rosea TaxID=990373 RepID=A0A2W7IK44_9PROT|nr:peptidylprolyl isomerase [Humitalea rosea]PZW38913.1 peptidyl-prolyl cis-trans isomerase C [Humitalea rosea]